jgi:hypothetical protein
MICKEYNMGMNHRVTTACFSLGQKGSYVGCSVRYMERALALCGEDSVTFGLVVGLFPSRNSRIELPDKNLCHNFDTAFHTSALTRFHGRDTGNVAPPCVHRRPFRPSCFRPWRCSELYRR